MMESSPEGGERKVGKNVTDKKTDAPLKYTIKLRPYNIEISNSNTKKWKTLQMVERKVRIKRQ